METTYTETDNLGLDLYGDNDPADLRDGYNSSMRKIDTAVKSNADAVALKADTSTTYSKTDVDTKLSAKADTATTYSKTDVDTKLSAKADTATTYSKPDVDGKVSSITTSVSTINNNIVAINQHLPIFHKGIIVGDSWSYANNETTTDQHTSLGPEYRMFVDIFGIDPSNILFIGCGGGGYITKSTDGNNRNFVDAISAIPDNFKDADIITFLGGQNDAGNTSAQEQSAVTSAINAALSKLPYAQVHVFHTPFSFTALNTDKQNIKIGQEAALAGLYNPRVFSHGNMHRAGVLLDNLCGHQSGVHLNNAGYGMLKNIMGKAVIDGGNCIFPSYSKSFSIPDSNDNFSWSGGSYYEDNSGIGVISFLGQTKKDLAATYEFARLDTSIITASFYSVGYSVTLDGTSAGSVNLNQSSNLVCATTLKANSLINVKTAVMAGF